MNSLGQLLRDYLGRSHEMMRESEAGVKREAGPEAVHDMRVGARRLRSALRLFDKAYSLPASHALLADLKWLAGGLGKVHDLALHLDALAREDWQSPDPSELSAFIAAVERDYRKSQVALHRMLLSKRYKKLMAASAGAAAGVLESKPALDAIPAPKEAPALLRPWVKKCRRKARKLRAGSSDRAYHKFRILCKRTRYAIQCLGESAPRPLARLARRLEKLQALLGSHQDDATRLAALNDFLDTPAGREPGPRRAARLLMAGRKRRHGKSRARIAKAAGQFARSRVLERAVKAVSAA